MATKDNGNGIGLEQQDGADGAVLPSQTEPPLGYQLDIRAHGFDLTPSLREYATQHILTKLNKHASHIQAVIIRFDDPNGSKGGVDKICRIEVIIPGQDPMVVEEIHEDLRASMDLAADRAERTVRRHIAKQSTKPRDQARKTVRNSKLAL